MNFNLWELKTMERLLANRINADHGHSDPELEELLEKVRKEKHSSGAKSKETNSE